MDSCHPIIMSAGHGGEEPRLGGGICPYCGTSGSYPSDMDSWWCLHCKREYPTRAFKCRHPDCWEFVFGKDYCTRHETEKKQTE